MDKINVCKCVRVRIFLYIISIHRIPLLIRSTNERNKRTNLRCYISSNPNRSIKIHFTFRPAAVYCESPHFT